MNKLKIGSIGLLVISTAAFVLFMFYSRAIQDTKAPTITFEQDIMDVSVQDDEAVLLEGMSADDNRLGDVSDRVIIEHLGDLTDENERTVTYAVMDDSMNAARATRKLHYTDYKPPVFEMSAPLCFPVGATPYALTNIGANSSLDGDLSDKVKYSMEKAIDYSKPGQYPVTFRVTDTAGRQVSLDTEIVMVERLMLVQDIQLTDYIVYKKKGSELSPRDYIASDDYTGTLKIDSNVDMSKKGTYAVDYYVINEQDVISGTTRLIVVVE